MSNVTSILQAIERGDVQAAQDLLPLVYEELRRLASQKMANEAKGHSLQATALVHEAYLRLVGADGRGPQWNSRGHFFAAAAEAMRRILIDRARASNARKRGGGRTRLRLEDADLSLDCPREELLDLDAALDKLAVEEPRKAELVRLRFFAGLTSPEAAKVLGIANRTAEEDWTYARAWLYRELKPSWSELEA